MRSRRLAAALLALCALTRGEARAAEWTDQTLEAIQEFALTDSAVRADAAGHPHVFVGGDRVYHYWQDAGGWHSEIVDAHARSGARLRAALGPSGEFHLVYQRTERTGQMNPRTQISPWDPPPTVTTLRHATNLSGQWVLDWISHPPSLTVSGLAIDANHRPHVLLDQVGAPEIHGTGTFGRWSFEEIDPNFPGATPSPYQSEEPYVGSELAIDGAGNLHAVWLPAGDPYAGGIVYAVRDDSGVWHAEKLQTVAGKNVVPVRPLFAMTLDGAGNPHILAHHGGGYLQDTYRTASGWAMDVFGNDLHYASTFAAAAGADGRVHVLTLTSSDTDGYTRINHLVKSGLTWSSEVAEDLLPPSYPQYLALAGDSSGGFHALSLAGNSNMLLPLRYLHLDAAWSAAVEVARGYAPSNDHLASVGADVRIGLIGTSRRILYRLGGIVAMGEPVKHRTESAPGEFEVEDVESTCGPAPGTLALAVDAAGRERAMWSCSAAREAIRGDDGEWTGFTPSGASTDWAMRPAIAFDAGGALHSAAISVVGSFFTAVHGVDTDHRLLEEVISGIGDYATGERPGTLAMAPGPLGSMVVAGLSGRALWVGSNATGQWVGSVVGEPPGSLPFGTYALAVTGDGVVHIAYENRNREPGSHPTLMYGTNACGGGFYATEVDPLMRPLGPTPQDFVVGSRNPDIALDALGNPHISYRREADHTLAYAHVVDGDWTIEPVVADTSSGEQSAIAVDANRVVSIAHHDDWAGDLRLATRAALPDEQPWDGCPPLPDPNALRDGSFLFAPPADALPLYDPTDENLEAYYGPSRLLLFVFAAPSGKLYSDAIGSLTGDATWGASGDGSGKVKGKRGRVSVKQALRVAEGDDTLVKLVRVESVDAVTGARTLDERMTGKIHGQKVDQSQSATDVAPASMLGLRLELEIHPGNKNALVASATWARGEYQETTFTGKGKWSPSTETADLVLKTKGGSLKLQGLRIWKSKADGIHLSARRATGSLLGQKIDVDLTSAFAAASATHAAGSSAR